MLYNRILFESWDHMFEEPRHKRKTRVEMGLDAVTEGFLDGVSLRARTEVKAKGS